LKSDTEIQAWIDSKDAMTQNELCMYLCGHRGKQTKLFLKWWDYVLDTKNWKTLTEHRNKKINAGFPPNDKRKEQIEQLFTKDIRLQTSGYKTGTKILNNVYGISVSRSYYQILLKKLKSNLCTN